MRLAVRWSIWLGQDPKREDSWNCELCVARGLDKTRSCEEQPQGNCKKGHGIFTFDECAWNEELDSPACPICGTGLRWEFALQLGSNYVVYKCPVQQIEPAHMFLVRLVMWSESTGCMPVGGGLLDQSHFYYEVRNIVVGEKMLADEDMRPKDTPDTHKPVTGGQSPRGRRGVVPISRGRGR